MTTAPARAVTPFTPHQTRNVFWLAIVLVAITTAFLPMYVLIAWQLSAWQVLIAGASVALLDVLALVSTWFTRHGRADIGAGHLVGGLLFMMVINALFIARIGLAFGAGSLLIIIGIVTQTVASQRWVTRALVLGMFASGLAGLLEILAPPFQAQTESFPNAIPAFVGVIVIAYGVIVLVSFRTYTLTNKLIVAFVTVAVFTAGLVAFADNFIVRQRFLKLLADTPQVVEALNATQQISLLSAMGALLLASLAALFIAQLVAQPIIQLTAVAQQVRDGNLTREAKVETSDEIGALAGAFNSMTAQLRQSLESLELRVAERTRALETSAQISRRLSTLLDENQVVAEVVQQLRTAYKYYHVHIYLYDAARENLKMAGGTGEAGRLMLARGHQLPRGKGLVGRAADTDATVLVPDVTQATGWLPNPLLPETKAEVAVPITLGGQVLGVLDVQQNVTGGLTATDAELIQTVALQTAIALQNARLYAQAQREAQTETLIRDITQKIQNTTTAPGALQTAIRELGKALSARQVSARLMTPQGESAAAGRDKQA